MSNFNHWYNEVADMPTQDKDGAWYDAETGFTYADYVKQSSKSTAERFQADDKVKAARAVAKKTGGKALTGSAKQKKWGEDIRANILKHVSSDVAELLTTSEMYQTAKFWIENRALSASEFASKALQVADLIAKASALLNEYESKVVILADRTIVRDAECDRLLKEREIIVKELDKIFII